jgi:hypothetical protein
VSARSPMALIFSQYAVKTIRLRQSMRLEVAGDRPVLLAGA